MSTSGKCRLYFSLFLLAILALDKFDTYLESTYPILVDYIFLSSRLVGLHLPRLLLETCWLWCLPLPLTERNAININLQFQTVNHCISARDQITCHCYVYNCVIDGDRNGSSVHVSFTIRWIGNQIWQWILNGFCLPPQWSIWFPDFQLIHYVNATQTKRCA